MHVCVWGGVHCVCVVHTIFVCGGGVCVVCTCVCGGVCTPCVVCVGSWEGVCTPCKPCVCCVCVCGVCVCVCVWRGCARRVCVCGGCVWCVGRGCAGV